MSATFPSVPMGSPVAVPAQVRNPPRMAVWLYILLCVLTLGIFAIIWGFRVSSWMRNIDPKSHATTWWAVAVVTSFFLYGLDIVMIIGVHQNAAAGIYDPNAENTLQFFSLLPDLAAIPYLIALFSARSSLKQYFNSVEPIQLKINPVLLFFFQTIYLQYKLNQVIARRGAFTQTPAPGPAVNPWQPRPALQAAPAGLCLQIAGQRHPLPLGNTFTAAQIPGLTAITASGIVAQVNANPADPKIVGLNNQSQQTWHVTLPGGEAAQIASGQTIRLTPGAQFWFGQIAGVVV